MAVRKKEKKRKKNANCKEKRYVHTCPNPLDKEEKKTRKVSADGLDPEEYPMQCADRSPMSHPCHRHPATATVLPLLPPSHTHRESLRRARIPCSHLPP